MNFTEPLKVVVLASGSGTLLQAILDNQDSHYQVVGVVADIPCMALERAERAGVDQRIVELGANRAAWNQKLADTVASFDPDLVVSAGFMKILGQVFLERFGGLTINTHPALLPSFKGAHAVRDALEYGVKVTGSTVHFVDSGVDTGPIIAQQPVPVLPGDTQDSLHERIKQEERKLIVSILRSAQVDHATRKVEFDQ